MNGKEIFQYLLCTAKLTDYCKVEFVNHNSRNNLNAADSARILRNFGEYQRTWCPMSCLSTTTRLLDNVLYMSWILPVTIIIITVSGILQRSKKNTFNACLYTYVLTLLSSRQNVHKIDNNHTSNILYHSSLLKVLTMIFRSSVGLFLLYSSLILYKV